MKAPRLLLIGDSLVDFGNWQTLLPQYPVISSGVPGEQAQELRRRLPVVTAACQADLVLLMIGTNDLLLGDRDFVATIEEIITDLNAALPAAELLVSSLLPFKLPGIQAAVQAVNLQLREVAVRQGSCYFDLYSAFAGAREDMFEADGVHLSPAAYRLWAAQLHDHIRHRQAQGRHSGR